MENIFIPARIQVKTGQYFTTLYCSIIANTDQGTRYSVKRFSTSGILAFSQFFRLLFFDIRNSLLNRNYTLGWVNLDQKLEIEKNTICSKVNSPKKYLEIFLNLFFAQMACGFAWICKFLQASYSPHF